MAALRRFNFSGKSSGEPEDFRATLAEHLEELRQRLFRIAGVMLAATIGCWFIADEAYRVFRQMALDALPKGVVLQFAFTDFTQGFFLQLKLAFFLGLIFVIPYTVLELWGFVAPGLRPNERKPIRVVAPLTACLFFLGAWMGWTILPVTFKWFFMFAFTFEGTVINQQPEGVIFFPINMLLAFGAGFQLPLVVYFLAWLNIVSPNMLMRYWRHGTVGVFLAAAIITPSGDVPTMLMMAVPMTALYFISVLAAYFTQRKGDNELDNLD